jgi:hypothetical protein
MNDPYVVALIYRVKHDASVNYEEALPLEYDCDAFTVRVKDGEARFQMKQHFETAEAAREEVEPFIRRWEFAATLKDGPGKFELLFKHAQIEDRNPSPGIIHVSTGDIVLVGMSASVVVGRGRYPDPPEGIAVNADVESMLARYSRYREGKDTLAGMSYFCLTVLEESAGNRAASASKFNVAESVLRTIGRLTGEKGGVEARKGRGRRSEFTPAERKWLDEALKLLIRRAAEVAYDPAQTRPQITMADLPDVK